MATYAIGDVHGCYDTLKKLLGKMPFKPGRDRLWLVGDLVNRGPKSLEVLRWARALEKRMGGRFQSVMGNHDLHLLAVARGLSRTRPGDTFKQLLRAPDRSKLLRWLLRRPLLWRQDGFLLVHAGLLPSWTVARAERKARKVEAMLTSRRRRYLLRRGPSRPAPAGGKGTEIERRRRDLEIFTRIRCCTAEGELCSFSGPPVAAPPGCVPWFELPDRRSRDATVVCGHWAALGLRLQPGLLALDTGCAWGDSLTAVRLDDLEVFRQKTVEKRFWP